MLTVSEFYIILSCSALATSLRAIIIHSKYFAVSDWLQSSDLFVITNYRAFTIFGRCKQYTMIGSMVQLIGKEAAWAIVN